MDNPIFFAFVHRIINLMLSELPSHTQDKCQPLCYALLEKTLVDLDDFAKNSKAEEIPFPDSVQVHLGLAKNSLTILSSKIFGTKNICQVYEDKIYKFGNKGFICRVTYLDSEYGDYSKNQNAPLPLLP